MSDAQAYAILLGVVVGLMIYCALEIFRMRKP